MNKLLFSAIIAGASLHAFADKGELHVGTGVNLGFTTYNESEFNSDIENTFYPYLYGAWDITDVDSVAMGYRSFDASIDAGTAGFGMETEVEQFYLEYSRKFRFSRKIKPWIFAGISSNTVTSTDRHSTDVDGFLDETFADREGSNTGFYAGIKTSIELTENTDIVPGVLYDFGSDESPNGLVIGVAIQYSLFGE